MQNEAPDDAAFAITTFGMNNHAVKTGGFRYIRYEDGGEELYDHKIDPHEWTNLAGNPEHSGKIEKLKKLLPTTNAKWDAHLKKDVQLYFVEQKARTSRAISPHISCLKYAPWLECSNSRRSRICLDFGEFRQLLS